MQHAEHLTKFKNAIQELLTRDLVIVSQPPDATCLQRSMELLELAFYTHIAIGGEGDEAELDARRRDGDTLLIFFNGDWHSWPPVHHCQGPSCCSSREAAVKKGVQAYMLLLRRRVPIPALNRWLQVFPVVTLFLVLMSVHNLFSRAELIVAGLDDAKQPAEPDSDSDPDTRVGAPADNKEHRRQARRRERRLREWAAAEDSCACLLIWTCVVSHLMTLHYYLFKCGALHGRDANGLSALFNLCSMKKSKAVELLRTMERCMDPANPEHKFVFGCALTMFGASATWPARLLRKAVVTVHLACGGLFRRPCSALKVLPMVLGSDRGR